MDVPIIILELTIPALTQSTDVPKLQYPCTSGGDTYKVIIIIEIVNR